jgi:hypothetical protein
MRGVVRLPGAPEAWPFGGPRGGWSTGCGAHQRGWAQVAQGASHPSRTSVVCGWRRAPWVRGAVAQAARPTPTEQRTGADRAKGSVVACGHPPWRGGSPLAFGGPRGWWSAEGGTHEERCGSAAGGAWRSCQASRQAEVCRAPWVRGAVPRARRAPPTEQRTGADRANGSCVACGGRPWRGGSPRAFGSAWRRSEAGRW